jgi:hypothetical protein
MLATGFDTIDPDDPTQLVDDELDDDPIGLLDDEEYERL